MGKWIQREKHPTIERGPQGPLTPAERQEFEELCAIVDRGLNVWIEVGKALYELSLERGKRLYREQYPTWQAFVRGRWGWTVTRAWQLANAAYRGERMQALVATGIPRKSVTLVNQNIDSLGGENVLTPEPADTCAPGPIKITERHVRALGRIPRERDPEVVRRALALGGRFTAAKVAQAAKEVQAEGESAEVRALAVRPRLESCLRKLDALRDDLMEISVLPGAEALRNAGDELGQHNLTLAATKCFVELGNWIRFAMKGGGE